MNRTLPVLTILLALTSACSRFPQAPELEVPQFAVTSVVWNGSEHNYVFVSRVGAPGEYLEPEETAHVQVEWDGHSVSLDTTTISPVAFGRVVYTDAQTPVQVLPNTTYFLRIQTNAGAVIRGQTTTPGDFHLAGLPDTSVMSVDPGGFALELKWTPSAGAKGYLCFVRRSPIRYPNGDVMRFPTRSFLVRDDTEWSTRLWASPAGRDTVELGVCAFDDNYDRAVFRGAEAAGLTNALGLFGSMICRSVTVYLEASSDTGSPSSTRVPPLNKQSILAPMPPPFRRRSFPNRAPFQSLHLLGWGH